MVKPQTCASEYKMHSMQFTTPKKTQEAHINVRVKNICVQHVVSRLFGSLTSTNT